MANFHTARNKGDNQRMGDFANCTVASLGKDYSCSATKLNRFIDRDLQRASALFIALGTFAVIYISFWFYVFWHFSKGTKREVIICLLTCFGRLGLSFGIRVITVGIVCLIGSLVVVVISTTVDNSLFITALIMPAMQRDLDRHFG